MSIKGKIAWITSSASGIGRETARLFAREGARLMLCDIDAGALEETRRELQEAGAQVAALPFDARRTADIDAVFEKLLEAYGGIDILVNNTGIAGPTKPLVDMTAEEWDETLEVNLRSHFYTIKLAAPTMCRQGSGKIVNLSSQSGKLALPNRSPYDASKMGVIGLTRCAAAELGPHGITVNTICPGPVQGARIDAVYKAYAEAQGVTLQQAEEYFVSPTMLGRAVPPGDVAQMALFLSDDERSHSITGQDFNVNCGAITY